MGTVSEVYDRRLLKGGAGSIGIKPVLQKLI